MIRRNIPLLANYLFALSMPISHSVAYVACGLGFFSVFRFWKKLRSEPLALWITVFIVYGLIRSFFSAKPMVGYDTMLNYFSHWLLPFVLGYCLSERKNVFFAFWLYYWLFIGLIFFSVLAYFGLFWGNIGNNYLVREGLLKGFKHHIVLAALSINLAFLSLAIGFFYKEMDRKKRLFFVLAGLFLVGAVGLTGARGYYIASSISLFCFLAWIMFTHKKYLTGVVVLFLLISISTGVYFISPLIRSRIESAMNPTDNSVTERIKLYRIALLEIKDKPIVGFGPGQAVYQKKYFDKIKIPDHNIEEKKFKHIHLHSFYLNLTAEFGLIGFFIFFIIIYLVFKKLWTTYKTENDLSKVIGIGLLFGLFSIMIGECFDSLFRGPKVAMDIFWITGLICGTKTVRKEPSLDSHKY